MRKSVWNDLGRPAWVVCAHEHYRNSRFGGLSPHPVLVFYRTLIPAYIDLDVIVRATDYTITFHVGTTTADGLDLTQVEPQPVELVEPDAAEPREGKYPRTRAVLLWDRGVRLDDAQVYLTEE